MDIVEKKEYKLIEELYPGAVFRGIDIGGYWMITSNSTSGSESYQVQCINLQSGDTMWFPNDGGVYPVLCQMQILAEACDAENE